jgi:putative endonuclease
MEYFVYIIRSVSSGKYYTGMTSNICRRLQEHNYHLSNTPTTKSLSDYELVFCQTVDDRIEARKLEKYLKSGFGREIREEIVKSLSVGS